SYGGWGGNNGIYKTGTGDLTMIGCTVSDMYGHGLVVAGSTGNHTITRNTFTSNDTGVHVVNQPDPVALNGNVIEGNTNWGILNQNSFEVDARSNWWGDKSGPYHATLNAAGLGDKVSDGVLFEPWLLTPPTSEFEIGDVNQDGQVDLKDAILVAKILVGVETTPETVTVGADVDGDKKISLPEFIYILQKVAGLSNY
ncbi:MAG: right-handed parallel beta-helix repeat-containing protein, partial [Desulfatirhabdiaceae bacterium]